MRDAAIQLQSAPAAPCCLVCTETDQARLAEEIAGRLSIPLVDSIDIPCAPAVGYFLRLDGQGLALQALGRKAPGPVRVEFGSGKLDHRRRFGGGRSQMIARAVGLGKVRHLQVLDVTAGLGADAFVLASLGCELELVERCQVVAELLRDGLRRGLKDSNTEVRQALRRMRLAVGDGRTCLERMAADSQRADIVYLDPMFPERKHASARVKKEMVVMQDMVGKDSDADALLPAALSVARFRVVVKRPRHAPFLNSEAPGYQLKGKSSRFDIYVNSAIG